MTSILFLLTLLLTENQGPQLLRLTTSQTLQIDPRLDRAAVHFHVHPDRPTLVVFSRNPDSRMIAGDETEWFITTPAKGLPDHAFHFKPKRALAGLVGNAHFLFDGYPLELVFHSTLDLKEAAPTVYLQIRGVEAKQALRVANREPAVYRLAEMAIHEPSQAEANRNHRRVFHEKRKGFGLLQWSADPSPVLIFQPGKQMAPISSLEVVRGKRAWGTRHMRYAHPLAKNPEKQGGRYVLPFKQVHLQPREHYYARIFFEGAKEPVYVRLKGLKGPAR